MFPQSENSSTIRGPYHSLKRQTPAANNVFLFDLDILVPSNFGQLDHHFGEYLREFVELAPCYAISNGSYSSVMARLPLSIRNGFEGIFASAGTEMWRREELLLRHDHDFSDDLYEFMVNVVRSSAYDKKNAPVLESGSATLRLQLSGTKSTARETAKYLAWERKHQELSEIIAEFKIRFTNYQICRDSEASLLIVPSSFSTVLVRDHLRRRHKSARLITCLAPNTMSGYLKPFCEALSDTDMISVVADPSDVSQLLCHERKILKASATPRLQTPNAQFQKA
ncbi:hypothetical protein TRICHSKD4_2633 [Roseibium sp. TrichSKD4]|uniref:hypothetical protein n=1 Tax=Roseibium sp. TrichSKD4 TaxID=744980 RepID=UPI0001E56E91|nr:hypothetical protein [Roseibium sp. TrichSKD4]EFO32044.1 hypothetical protein TRICHSKD4_2633 [Roseibium sp. TrichSKD4]